MIKLLCCVGDYSPVLLSRFFKYHLKLGIDEFLIILHSESLDRPSLHHAREQLGALGLKPVKIWTGDFTTFQKHRYMNQVFDTHVRSDDWVVPADLDEFRVFPGKLAEFLEECEKNGYRYVAGQLLDRIAVDGSFPEIQPSRPLSSQFPLGCRITKTLARAHTSKIVALRGSLRFNMGHHFLAPPFRYSWWKSQYPEILNVDHFRWDSLVLERLRKRAEVFKKRGVEWYRESEQVLMFLSENNWKLRPDHPLVKAFPVDEDPSFICV